MSAAIKNSLEKKVFNVMDAIAGCGVTTPRPATLAVLTEAVIRLIDPLENLGEVQLVEKAVKSWLYGKGWTPSRVHSPGREGKILVYAPPKTRAHRKTNAGHQSAACKPVRLARQFDRVDLTTVGNVVLVHIGNIESTLIQAGAVAGKDYNWAMLITCGIQLAIASGDVLGKDVVLEDLEPSQ